MDNSSMFVRANEVAADLEVSVPQAYRLIRQMNQELEEQGYMTISGRVSRKYYVERFYGFAPEKKGDEEDEAMQKEQ